MADLFYQKNSKIGTFNPHYYPITENFFIDDENQVQNIYNQYETSSIRRWLNEDFLNLCFSKEGQDKIAETENENGGEKEYGGKIFYKNTIDKVYLLSKKEIDNMESLSPLKNAEMTDYCKAMMMQYEYIGNIDRTYSDWITRSPYEHFEDGYYVGGDGSVLHDVVCMSPDCNLYNLYAGEASGIRPALTLNV